MSGIYSFRKGVGIILWIRSYLGRFLLGEMFNRIIFFFLIMFKNWVFNSVKLKERKDWFGGF